MAIIQALFALISKSAGKILNAIFGWAVRALFGRTSDRERTFLSGLVAAAAAWPLLLVGVAFPKAAALLLAFVPVPHAIPSWVVRLVWLGLVAIVPLAIGLTMATKAPAHAAQQSFAKRLLSGFPITVGLALAFLIMFVTVPLMRFWAALRGQKSVDVPLVTEASQYHQTAALVVSVLNRHGFGLTPAKPGWWVAAPTRVLRFFGGDAFGNFVPGELEYYEAPNLTVSLYPSGFLLRGTGRYLTWAHGLIAENTARGEGFQTSSPSAQNLEKQIKRVWKVYDEEPHAHRDAPRLLSRVDDIGRELASLDVEFDDWQMVYRQLLQLARALHGDRQLLEKQAREHDGANGVGGNGHRQAAGSGFVRTKQVGDGQQGRR
ncbi:MAG: hypothetical protein ABIS92_04105 [Polyangia bacterium]